MTKTPKIALDEIMASDSSSVDPARHPDEVFDLYSVPAFDSGQPEVIVGSKIGSSKQAVKPGDVLLARIVPHIRRAWVVGELRGRRQIASGEWIVFRCNRLHPSYLRYLLVNDAFHAKFMKTVAGVGGSLLRARPAQVADIEIPLPDLAEQKRIAAILERADRLRRLRRYGLEMAAQLGATMFLNIFCDRARREGSWPTNLLDEVVEPDRGITYGIVQAGPNVPDGVPYVRTGDIVDGQIKTEGLLRTSKEIAASYKRSEVKFGDLVFSIRATVGTVALLPKNLDGANLTQGTARIAPGDGIDKRFLLWQLRSRETQDWVRQQVKGSTFLEITLARLRELPVFVPPIELQKRFAEMAEGHERIIAIHRESLRQAEHLFQTLLHRAFTGGL